MVTGRRGRLHGRGSEHETRNRKFVDRLVDKSLKHRERNSSNARYEVAWIAVCGHTSRERAWNRVLQWLLEQSIRRAVWWHGNPIGCWFPWSESHHLLMTAVSQSWMESMDEAFATWSIATLFLNEALQLCSWIGMNKGQCLSLWITACHQLVWDWYLNQSIWDWYLNWPNASYVARCNNNINFI